MSQTLSLFRFQQIGQLICLLCLLMVFGTAFAIDTSVTDSSQSEGSVRSENWKIAGMTLKDCIEKLDSEVRTERLRAIRTIGFFDDAAAEPLREALQHSDPAVRFLAATSLGRIGGKGLQSSVENLAKRVGDPQRKLSDDRDSNSSPGDASQSVRVAAAYALCEAGQTDKYLDVIVDALSHPDRGMSCYAADLIGRLGRDAEAALPTLRQVHAANKPGVSGGDYHRGGAAMNAIRKIRGQ